MNNWPERVGFSQTMWLKARFRAYEASDEAYSKGRPVLFNDAGVVKEHWLLET